MTAVKTVDEFNLSQAPVSATQVRKRADEAKLPAPSS